MSGRVLGCFVLVGLSAPMALGCARATTSAEEEARVPVVSAPAPIPDAHEEAPRPIARPRLDRTITLGQGSWAPTESAQGARAAAGAAPVVVNNHVVVNNTPPAYFGYGGFGVGYGSHGARAVAAPSPRIGGAWGTTGWEGPRHTAAPGQTPGVGGNWAPAPSFGPAPMR